MRNEPIGKVFALMLLGVMLIVWSGCGDSDEPLVKAETPSEPEELTSDTPIPVTLTGSLKGEVEKIVGVQFNIRLLQDGTVVSSVEADADGNYRIDNIAPGVYTVQMTARGYEAVEQTVQIHADDVALLDRVALKALEIPVPHIQGRLLNQATKQPLDRARLQLLDETGNVREVLTNETGAFEFENVPAEQQLTLIIDTDGFERQELPIPPIPAGEIATVDVELVRLPRFRGLLSDHITKQPLAGFLLQLIDEAGNVHEATTRGTGLFAFEGLPAGQRFTLLINHEKYEKQELLIDPIPAGEVAITEVELVPLDRDQLPVGEGLEVGTKAPDFRLPDGDGKIHALADYAGQNKVVLVFDRGNW